MKRSKGVSRVGFALGLLLAACGSVEGPVASLEDSASVRVGADLEETGAADAQVAGGELEDTSAPHSETLDAESVPGPEEVEVSLDVTHDGNTSASEDTSEAAGCALDNLPWDGDIPRWFRNKTEQFGIAHQFTTDKNTSKCSQNVSLVSKCAIL